MWLAANLLTSVGQKGVSISAVDGVVDGDNIFRVKGLSEEKMIWEAFEGLGSIWVEIPTQGWTYRCGAQHQSLSRHIKLEVIAIQMVIKTSVRRNSNGTIIRTELWKHKEGMDVSCRWRSSLVGISS